MKYLKFARSSFKKNFTCKANFRVLMELKLILFCLLVHRFSTDLSRPFGLARNLHRPVGLFIFLFYSMYLPKVLISIILSHHRNSELI